ncbi:MAG: hypothetical protein ACFE94_19165 [Candidatus Hodarchaeota archaeon]
MNNKLHGQKHNLSDMIEKIFFDVKELELLKELIRNVAMGRVDPKQLRTAIIENRENFKSKIIEIFPYYHKQISYQQQIDNFAEKEIPSQIQNELKEKNELLQKVGKLIHNLLKKLEEDSPI